MPTVDPVYVLLALWFTAALWLSTGLGKMIDLEGHKQVVRDYGLLPEGMVSFFSVGQPFIEVALGISLALAWWIQVLRPISAFASILLLSLYSIAIGLNLARGRRSIECGCAGPGQRQELSGGLLLRNMALVLISFASALTVQPRFFGGLDIMTTVLGLTGMWILYATVNQALSQVRVSNMLRGR